MSRVRGEISRVGGELRRFTSAAHASARYVAQRMILKPVVWSVTRVRVLGRERLRSLGPSFIVVANHSSHLDAPLIAGALPASKARYLAAGAAADYFFEIRWRRFLTALFFNAFPVDRRGARNRPGFAKRLLGAGVPLLIFPEGSRSKSGEMGQFKVGAAALSISSAVPCLPVAIIGASAAMPRGRSWPVPGRPPVAVVFGSPMTAQPGERAEEFTRRLEAEIQELQELVSAFRVSRRGRWRERPDMTLEAAPRVDADVKHMKWWGWGVDGVAFHYDDKPDFAPFVRYAVGLDLSLPAREPIAFDQLAVPASRIAPDLLARLESVAGADHVTTDDMDRLVHTYGKSIRDLLRIRLNLIERAPDVVVYPADEAEILEVVRIAVETDAVLIPFGGGSNISGSLEPMPAEERTVISLDMGRLRSVLSIDEGSGIARVQAGVQGPDLEEQLNARGWTMGHFPDSFTHSTLGGWVATRSSGMQSDKYGDIADIVRGLRLVQAEGVLELRPLPSTSTGPSVREMIIGSEGRLGVITEVAVQVHRTPEAREIIGYFFPTWDAGIAAMREIAESDASPSVTRISDARESGFSFATRKESKGIAAAGTKALMGLLKRRGWDLDQLCLSFIGYEGSSSHVSYEKRLVGQIVRKHGGMAVGKGPGALYDQKKFDTPYIRDFLLDRGAAADVSETAAPWSRLQRVYDTVVDAANGAYAELGVQGWIMCHLSHSYRSGACLYFTFAFVHGDDPVAQYDIVKRAIQQAFIDGGGTLSHHHAVGVEHAPWLEQDISSRGVAMMQGLFDGADPGRNLNPGKIIPGS